MTNNPLGQSFTAGINGIDYAKFDIYNTNSGTTPSQLATFEVDLYNGIGVNGSPIATTNLIMVPANSSSTTYEFDFANRVALTLGNQYTLIVKPLSGNAGDPDLDFDTTSNVYSGGTLIIQGSSQMGGDAIFSEGVNTNNGPYTVAVATPEPSTLILAACGVPALLGLGYRRYRRSRVA